MSKIESFEDFQSWQKARAFAYIIYDLSGDSKLAAEFRLCNQIWGAAGSVMHNIMPDQT
jgi:four helix bundle protein